MLLNGRCPICWSSSYCWCSGSVNTINLIRSHCRCSLRWTHVVDEAVDLLNQRWICCLVDGAAAGQEEDGIEVIAKCWDGLLVEVVVSQLHVHRQLVELAVDVLLIDHKRLMPWKN